MLTFRNVHNWRFDGKDNTADAFRQIYAMLKPGGVLGVEEHRLDESDDPAKEEKSGYMKESSIIAFAEAAGFKLARQERNQCQPERYEGLSQGRLDIAAFPARGRG
nr:hypothetical protein [Sphingopyxis sp. PET50]